MTHTFYTIYLKAIYGDKSASHIESRLPVRSIPDWALPRVPTSLTFGSFRTPQNSGTQFSSKALSSDGILMMVEEGIAGNGAFEIGG